jgi:hypothetical protein
MLLNNELKMQRAVQNALVRLPFTNNKSSPMYGESKLLKSMLQLPSDIHDTDHVECFDCFFENINKISWETRKLPTPPYIGFRHNGVEHDDFTIYFQRKGQELTEAILSADDNWKPRKCDCDDDCEDDCPAKRWFITKYKERQLSPLEIFDMIARNPSFLDVLTHNWSDQTIQTLISLGNSMEMSFFNPLTMLNTSEYYEKRVCIVCHTPVKLINRYRLVRCENKYCINTGKEYCNYIKTSISETCSSLPPCIVYIIMQYYTSINNRRRTGDSERVGDEFFAMARFIIGNMTIL